MRVFLLNPYHGEKELRVGRCMQKTSSWSATWPPLELMSVQATLEKSGVTTKLLDCVPSRTSVQGAIRSVRAFGPSHVVINTSFTTLQKDFRLAESLKQYGPIAIGAPTTLASGFEDSCFESWVSGDPEPGVLRAVRGEKGLVKEWADLDALPTPSVKDLDLQDYTLPVSDEPLMLVDPGRGCTNACSFCIVPRLNKGFRMKSFQKTVREVEEFKRRGVNNFLLWVENAGADSFWIKNFCEALIQKKVGVKWMAPLRADSVDEETLSLMRRAGCWMVSFGVECLNQKVLDSCNKGLSVDNIKHAITLAKQAGLKVVAHVIIGLPSQTRRSVESTVEWLRGKADYAQFYFATPYPGTPLRVKAEEEGWVEGEVVSTDYPSMRNEHMTTKELEELRGWAYKKFYLKPRRVLEEVVRSKRNVRSLARSGTDFLKNWVKL